MKLIIYKNNMIFYIVNLNMKRKQEIEIADINIIYIDTKNKNIALLSKDNCFKQRALKI